jgi:polysaccharide pyruvyl transferase WcaK-like protein
MRIVFVNYWHDDNPGDRAILHSILKLFYSFEKKISITVVSRSRQENCVNSLKGYSFHLPFK